MANLEFSLDQQTTPSFEDVAFDVSVEEVKDLHFKLLMQLQQLTDPDISVAMKWDLWEWVHDDREGPCSFRAACAIEGCDPEEVVLLLHETLERNGVWVQRPIPVRRSYRKILALQSAGVDIQPRIEDMPQRIGRMDRPQMDLFAQDSAEETIHV